MSILSFSVYLDQVVLKCAKTVDTLQSGAQKTSTDCEKIGAARSLGTQIFSGFLYGCFLFLTILSYYCRESIKTTSSLPVSGGVYN